MDIKLNRITGIDDAICSIYVSKGNLTVEKEKYIRELHDQVVNRFGDVMTFVSDYDLNEFRKEFDKMMKIGKMHITVLRYIDLSFTVRGLHRGAQDDLDAHAKRFDNRIIRGSTRLAGVEPGAKSDYYKNKILTYDDIADELDLEIPQEVEIGGVKYIRTVNGYINAEYADKKHPEHHDVARGLVMLSVPSNCIFKVNLCEFAHIYKMRNKDTHAAPELKECIESATTQIANALAIDGEEFRKFLMEVPN